MALNIKHPDADRLARELASTTGESLTEAVLKALQERLERQKAKTSGRRSVKDILSEARRRFSEYPVLDPRSPEEIIGYGQTGLPR